MVIGRLSRRLRPTAAGSAAGLTPTKTAVLLTVVREDQIRISTLAEIENLNPTMLSRAISGLVDAGILERSSDEGDRRAAWVQATPAGIELAQRVRRERTDAVNAAMEMLPAADRRVLAQALPALESLAEQLVERRP
jgi:DNA-binding MarR family transcriptional regulator